MAPKPDFPALPFDTFREQLDSAVLATINKVDREWPAKYEDHPRAGVLLESLLRTSENTYRTVRYVVADHPVDPSRKVEFALSVPPLTRTVLDALFTVIFLFEDLPRMTDWYYKSGWRELVEEQERHRERYGQEANWSSWLAEKDQVIAATREQWGVTSKEAADLKLIKWWPTPGAMKSSSEISQERKQYLIYLNDWFYRSLSSQSHMSWPGLAYRSAALLPKQDQEDRSWRLSKQKSDVFATTAVLVLALASEVEMELRYGLSERLKYIWGVLSGYYGYARDLYEMRYQSKL